MKKQNNEIEIMMNNSGFTGNIKNWEELVKMSAPAITSLSGGAIKTGGNLSAAIAVGGESFLAHQAGKTAVNMMNNTVGKNVTKTALRSSRAAGAVAVGLQVAACGIKQYQIEDDYANGKITKREHHEETGGNFGGSAGSLGGAGLGALICSAICPGFGTLIGGLLGGILGGEGGEAAGREIGKNW